MLQRILKKKGLHFRKNSPFANINDGLLYYNFVLHSFVTCGNNKGIDTF